MKQAQYILHCDGATYNSNPSKKTGVGVICYTGDYKKVVFQMSESTGPGTNNWAEYMSLLIGLDEARRKGIKDIGIMMDSKLVINQCKNLWRVKHPEIRPLHNMVMDMIKDFNFIYFCWCPREANSAADKLSKTALNKRFNSI